MINALSGIVKESNESLITIDVNGLGFGVQVPQGALFIAGQKVDLLVHMHWNQENGPTLLGFNNPARKIGLSDDHQLFRTWPKIGNGSTCATRRG